MDSELDQELKARLDELIEGIAKKCLGIPTLKPRGRDRLDFHDVGVVGLKKALVQAFEAGFTAGQAIN